ncbi:MAG: hypothetical protein K2M50_10475 [Treponemataceae bacterium]|nr:hypothetical protein [Treponemataceae bacterium]
MKNTFKLLCIFYALLLLICAASCSTDDSDENSAPTLKSIQVTEAKLDYCVGDAPKASVIAIYSDGHNEIVTDKVQFTPSIIEKNTSFINCFYSEGGNSANYTLRINVGERTLKSIETVELSPQIEGEKADMSKLIVLANYSNYDVEKIDLNEIEYSPIDLVTADDNGKATLTITYKDITYNISLSVIQKSNASITLKSVTAASLKSYTQGESFDKKQTVVLAVYSDGSTKDISSEAHYSAPERFSLGENDILFTYTEGTITKSCTLKITVFANTSENESSTLLTPPTLTALEVFGQNAYTSGKSLDTSKIVLLALYSDGSIKKIEKGFDFSPEIFNESTKNIEFSYTENNITVKYTFPITVQCEVFDPTEGGTIPAYNQTLLNTYGIGFGFNVITAPYFDTSYKSTMSILNSSKLTEKYVSKVKNSNNTTTGEVINNAISGYAENYSNSLNIPDISLNGGVKVFTASIGVSFKSVDIEKFTSKSNQLFYTHYDYRKPYYVQVVNITPDKFQHILSDNFLEDVKGESSKTKGLSVEEQAAYIIDTYGTHLITGIYLGGRYEYSYAFASDSSELIGIIEKDIGVKCSFDLGISGASGGISSGVENGETIETVIKSDNVESQFNAVIMGGASNSGGWTVGSMKNAYQEWRQSFNDIDSETGTSNWVPVGVTNNGLLGIWELIPQGYETLANAIIEKYRADAAEVYSTIIEKYAPKANIPQPGTIDSTTSEEDTVVLLDFSSCYSNSPRRDFFAPTNFSNEQLANVYKDGVITVVDAIGGVKKTKYIIKGAYNQKYNNTETISSKMLGLLIDIQAENPVEIELIDMSFQAKAGTSAILYSGEKTPEITLKITGENSISPNNNDVNSKPVATIFFDKYKQLKLTGEGNLIITSISGHLGASGKNAGENGGDGTDGARAISAGYLTIDMTGNLTCYGGDGGNGGNGAQGRAADSSAGISAGMGGNGGSGGKGGAALYITTKLDYKHSGIITLHSGKGGYGGNGGTGGDDANGGNAGSGGHGGKGGASDYCIFVDAPFKNAIYNVKLTPHKCGEGGNGGNGGNATGSGKCGSGGNGGNGGECHIAAGISECTIAPIWSSSSGNGGNGGNCGAASKTNCHSTPGKGGVCGKVSSSVSHSVPNGTNGNNGVSGTTSNK